MTLENLYKILKKNVEVLKIEDLAKPELLYNEEYNLALAEFYMIEDKNEIANRIKLVRQMERSVLFYLTQHCFQLIADGVL